MHDWKRIVRGNLGNLRLSARERKEVVAELAEHLEELYEDLRADGLPEPDALERCLSQLSEVRLAAGDFERAKRKGGAMNYRSKTLWLPGLVTLTLASVFLMVLQRLALLQPRIYWVDDGALVLHLPWLMLLPLCGAAGAYLSRRAGGPSLSCLVAGTFPAVVMVGVLCLILPIGVFIERNTYIIHHPLYFGLALLNWTILPGAGLLLGAVPVMQMRNHLPRN
jgi:hypothetical protein